MVETMTTETRGAQNRPVRGGWRCAVAPQVLGYCFDVRLVQQEVGYTAYIAQLPGVISEGDDAAAALRNIREAFLGVIETYREDDRPIPWKPASKRTDDEEEFRVAVNV